MSQVQKNAPQPQDDEQPVEVAQHDVSDLMDEADDLLDDIDAALEENAQEFVASFVQKGGE